MVETVSVLRRTRVYYDEPIDVKPEQILEFAHGSRTTGTAIITYIEDVELRCGVNDCKREVDDPDDVCWQHEEGD